MVSKSVPCEHPALGDLNNDLLRDAVHKERWKGTYKSPESLQNKGRLNTQSHNLKKSRETSF